MLQNIIKKRKTRSDKFPLTLHPTGQFCKKIKGKLYYFGKDKKIALQRYLEQAAFLHTGKTILIEKEDSLALKTLCNLYLEYQEKKVQANNLSAGHFQDQVKSLRKFTTFLGQYCEIEQIGTLDLQNYKQKLLKCFSAQRVNLNIGIMKAMFHWAKKNDVLKNIPNIDAINKVKIIKKERNVFIPEHILKLLQFSDNQMRAMILLGLNCGFGCTDCAELKWNDLDIDNSRVNLPRSKTGIGRNLLLWQDTVDTIAKLPKRGELVFYTRNGNPWVRTIKNIKADGTVKYVNDNAISKSFSKLLKKTGIKAEKGVGFYTLRRTSATMAARSGDPFAVQKLLGHADLKMATTYVQDVSEQTDQVVNNMRKLIIPDAS
ncbi:MAG: hypothetical protein A2Y10_15415 [Planctomycetes bacterium GWF2_41_51]|nr:MAG: hypothetical protein A2Y10_15415 [Planctomycetes bacterium GWF2_41_51]HBG26988.1 hypothetical protein [Phycisphaerales bacterium]